MEIQILFYDIDCTNNGTDITKILNSHSEAYGQQEHFIIICDLPCTTEILKQVGTEFDVVTTCMSAQKI